LLSDAVRDADLRAFGDIVRVPAPEIDLARGALCIARIEHPRLISEHSLQQLDELAARCGAAGLGDELRILHRLREFLFAEEGFRGNSDDYYDPRNSCLNDVLARKRGIPITLAIVMMEVGARVGLRILGVGLPGHFVVSARVGADSVLLDPFSGGAVLTLEGAHKVVARAVGRSVKLTEASFVPTT
jgi:regulator of sirC expression with transglutaminase-like and TPR domain